MNDRENIDCYLEEAFGSIRRLAAAHRGYLARLAFVADVVDWVQLLDNIVVRSWGFVSKLSIKITLCDAAIEGLQVGRKNPDILLSHLLLMVLLHRFYKTYTPSLVCHEIT